MVDPRKSQIEEILSKIFPKFLNLYESTYFLRLNLFYRIASWVTENVLCALPNDFFSGTNRRKIIVFRIFELSEIFFHKFKT